MYGYRCEYCEGTAQPRTVKREAFKHRDGFVILEDVVIGVCDTCGNRYYSAEILHAVHATVVASLQPKDNFASVVKEGLSPTDKWLGERG